MLTIFPTSSLDNSILTSVLIGLFVVWALQETLGWNFTGLVVPGYLASILTIHPTTGLVVVLEAAVTVSVVLLLSERVPAWWPWTRLFGRDRFFLFLLTSVAVRLALEGGGFELVRERLGLQVEDGLHSMGLVLVPLLANALWRAGPGGVPRVAIPVLITWALLARVFVPATNLSLSSFELTYEDLALDFVGSPRAYILLLVGAAMGSWTNQRWGWDHGGIIVPGLLSLCWLQPSALLTTFGESVLIALMLKGALRLPGLRGANLTGGRPLVLAFTLGYLAKFTLGWLFGGAWPGFAPRDLYGFGYLLSAIVALRIAKHGEPFRTVLPSLTTSLAAFLTGSLLAGALAVVLPPQPPDRPSPKVAAVRPWRTADWDDFVSGGGVTVRVRADGRPLAVVAPLGPLAMDGAALAVADALDARALVFCAAETCEEAGGQLGEMPVVRLAAGDADAVRVEARLAEALDLGRLGAIVGKFVVGEGEGDDTIVLTTATRVRLAARKLGVEPEIVTAGALPEAAPGPGRLPDAAEARGFREMVLRPWLGGLRQDAWREDGLRLAAGNAAAAGLSLERVGSVSVLTGAGWRMVADAAGGPVIVVVPDAAHARRARAFGRAVARAFEAALLVEEDSTEGPTWTHAGVLTALEALGPAARVITVRAVPDTADPGADVVLSVGRPLPPGASRPVLVQGLSTRLDAAGFSVALYDGGARRLGFADAAEPAREAARANAGEDAQATVFVTGAAAAAVAPVEGVALASLFPTRVADVREVVGEGGSTASGVEWRSALDAALGGGRTALARAASRKVAAAGGSVSLLRDPLLGLRWLEVRGCRGCAPRLYSLLSPSRIREEGGEGQARGAGSTARPLDALAFGAVGVAP